MNSNVIYLSAALEARKNKRTFTRKQELTVELRNHYREGRWLIKSIYSRRVKKLREVFKTIELQEEELLKL